MGRGGDGPNITGPLNGRFKVCGGAGSFFLRGLLGGIVSVFQIDCGELCTNLLYVKFVIPGQPAEHPSSLSAVSSPVLPSFVSPSDCSGPGQLTRVIFGFSQL